MSYSTRIRQLSGALAATALMTLAMGCSSGADRGESSDSASVVAPSPGWLVVDWSIDGKAAAEQCDRLGAAVIGITVSTPDGAAVRDDRHPCTSFDSTIQLAVGHYSANAVLLDGADGVRTSSVPIYNFEIQSGSPLRVPIDFASDSADPPVVLSQADRSR